MRLRIVLLAALVSLAQGCVSHLPMKEQAPQVSFKSTAPVAVSVIDQRHWLREGKDGTFIGRAHGTFGIPVDLQVYPFYAVGREHKAQTLASALEERIVFGLAEDGWHATASVSVVPLTPETARAALAGNPDGKLLVVTLREWFVSLNFNVVSAFNFDWDADVQVFSADGSSVEHAAKGRDVVDVAYNQSYPNHIRLAYRERLTKLLEEPEIRAALEARSPTAPPSAPAE